MSATCTAKEHPILFSGPMVRATMEKLKRMTRRVPSSTNSLVDGERWSAKRFAGLDFDFALIDPGPSPAGTHGPYLRVPNADGIIHRVYPLYQPGDRLWVKETWGLDEAYCVGIQFRADWPEDEILHARKTTGWRWKPSIFMPREASRITLEVTRVRVERLRDISEEDAEAEGVERGICCGECSAPRLTEVRPFSELWESIHGPGSWSANPFCWVIEFRRIKP